MHRLLQATLDALPTGIALLDNRGQIVLINTAWCTFHRSVLATPLCSSVGDNLIKAYQAVGDLKTPGMTSAIRAIATGIGEVLAGQRDSFGLECPGSGQGQNDLAGAIKNVHWFGLRVTRLNDETGFGPSDHLVVIWEDITKGKYAERALRENQAQLRLVTEAGGVGLWQWDLATDRHTWNAQLKAIFGLSENVSELTTGTYLDAIHRDDVGETERIIRTALTLHQDYEHTYRIVRPDGTVRWIAARGRGYYDTTGNVLQMCGSAVDVTRAKATADALQESQERFRNSFTSAAIGKALVSLDGRCLQVNPALCDLLGYEESALLQLTFQDITHSDDLETDLELAQQLVQGTLDCYQLEKRYLHQRGHEIWALLSVSVVRTSAGTPLYFVSEVVDISAQKRDLQLLQQANARLHHLAHDDALTGLKNRRSFDERLKQEIALAKRGGAAFSVLLLDLDFFKRLNDCYGHLVGDEVLQTIGYVLRQVMRPGDFIARYGGEEFALILPCTGVAGSVRAAQRAREAVATYQWPRRAMTASIGVATWNNEDAQTLLVKADLALYAAKGSGRNCVSHYSTSRDKEEVSAS